MELSWQVGKCDCVPWPLYSITWVNPSENNLVFCSNINGLMAALKIDYKSDKWRLFIDWSKLSLTASLLYNTNLFPSVPIGYAVYMK